MSRLVELGYAAGWSVIQALPRSVAWPLFRAGADRAARRQRSRHAAAAPQPAPGGRPRLPEAELDVLVRDGLRSYARYWLEAFRLPKFAPAQLLREFRLERGHLLGEAVEAGNRLRRRAAARRQLGLRRGLGLLPTAGR